MRSWAKSPRRFLGFPSSSSARRRWARSQTFFPPILKPIGAGPLKPRSRARASKRSCPRPRMAFGSNPSIRQRKARGRFDPAVLGGSSRDSIIPAPTRPTPRRSTTSLMERTACRSCPPARSALTVLASERFDSATLHKAFDGVRFDAGANFELDLGPDGPDQALRFGALIERSGARPEDCPVAFGLDPFAACGARTVPGRLERSSEAPCRDRARVAKPRVSKGRSWSLTRAPSMRLAEARRKSLPLRSRPQ